MTSSWLLQPVTWNSGTLIRVARVGALGTVDADAPHARSRRWPGSSRARSSRPLETRSCRSCRRSRPDHRAPGPRRPTGSPSGSGIAGAKHVARAAVGDDVLHLGLLEAGIDWHRDRPCQLRAPEGQHPVEAVGQQDRRPVAALDARPRAAPRPRARPAPTALVGDVLLRRPRSPPLPSGRDRRSHAACARAEAGRPLYREIPSSAALDARCARKDCGRERPGRVGAHGRSTGSGALSWRALRVDQDLGVRLGRGERVEGGRDAARARRRRSAAAPHRPCRRPACAGFRGTRAAVYPTTKRRSISLLIAIDGRIVSSPMHTPTPITREKQRRAR